MGSLSCLWSFSLQRGLRYDWKYHCHAGGGWGNGSGLSVRRGWLPFCVRQTLLSSSPKTVTPDRRTTTTWKRHEEGEERRTPSESKSNGTLKCPLTRAVKQPQNAFLCAVSVESSLPAGSSRFGNAGCHSSVSTEMSSSSTRRGEAWGQTPRPTDRQTAGSPALGSWNSSHFSQEVVAHWDASLLRHNKVGFYRPKHTGRKVWG